VISEPSSETLSAAQNLLKSLRGIVLSLPATCCIPVRNSWGWHAGLLEAAETARLRAAAEGDPKGAAATFGRAVALRDAIDRLFRAVARSATPEERDLALVGEEYAAAVAHARLLPDGDAYTWSWEGTPDDLGRPPCGRSPAPPSSCSPAATCAG
jgi:Putative stress-induced transcription regulator